MTINLSGKTGGGGGIGNATYDPRTLPSYLSAINTIYLKSAVATNYQDGSANFWSEYASCGNIYASVTEATYYTMLDYSSGPGNIFSIISPTHDSSLGTGEIKFKITVDGTEYIFGPSISTGRRGYRFIVGSFAPGTPDIANNYYASPFTPGGYHDNGFASYADASAPQRMQTITVIDPLRAVLSGHPYLTWKESIKVEVLVNNIHSSNYYKNAGINYSYVING